MGRFINRFIDFSHQNSSDKFEVLNKNFLIGRNSKFDFYESITHFLANVLQLPQSASQSFISRHILQIESILDVFENLIFRKKGSTIEKDLLRTIDLLKSPMYFQILNQLILTQEPEVVYKATVIMNVIIVCLEDKDKVKMFQAMILNHSTLFLRLIEFCLRPCSSKQKHYSIILICNCLIDNQPACQLIMRLIPKPLFYLVEENLGDISKWSISQWEVLFQHMNNNYNTATQQWSDESRLELLGVLRREIDNFYSHFKPVSDTQSRAFIFEMFKSPNYKLSKEQEEKLIQLKWNFEEYEVDHKSLKRKFPVYKYYIDEIVQDKPSPELTVQHFRNPKKFWDELCTSLIASNDMAEKVKLLKCLVLLYKNNAKAIRDTNIIVYLTKQVDKVVESGLNYLVLQLLFTLLENDPVGSNARRFIDCNGLLVIRDFIGHNLFEENLNEVDTGQLENDFAALDPSKSVQRFSKMLNNAKMEMDKSATLNLLHNVVFLFNDPGINREALTMELLRSNEVIFCIKIFKQCILRTKSQTDESLMLIPKPLAKEVAFQPQTIQLFHKVLMLKDDKLMVAALDFIMVSYIDKFNFQTFIEHKWVFPMLMSRINDINARQIASFFERVLCSFAKSATDDKRVLFEDLRCFNVNSPINDLSLYGKEGNRKLQDNQLLFEVFEEFPAFCLLPMYFYHLLLSEGSDAFVRTLFSEQVDLPFLVWNRTALSALKQGLAKMLSGLERKPSAKWKTCTVHYSFADELCVGSVLLRNWVFSPKSVGVIPLANVPDFLKSLTKMLRSTLLSIRQENWNLLAKLSKFYLVTLAIAHLYKTLFLNPGEEFQLIEIFFKYYSHHEKEDFALFNEPERNYLDCSVVNCLKIICNSIKTENSFEQIDFCKSKSLQSRVLRLFQRCIRNTVQGESTVSFHQFKMNKAFLKILKKIFVINGFSVVSFKGSASGQSNEQTDGTDTDELAFDACQLLANLDIGLVKNYIRMITDKAAQDNGKTNSKTFKRGSLVANELREKILASNKTAFKRAKHPDLVIESVVHQDSSQDPKMPSLQNSIAEKDKPVESGVPFVKRTSVEKAEGEVTPGLQKTSETIEDEALVHLVVEVREEVQMNFKSLLKRMNYNELRNTIGNMDLSSTSLSEMLQVSQIASLSKAVLSTPKGSTFYSVLKKMLQSFFLIWIEVVNKLSLNRKNIPAMIDACLPFVCFRIATIDCSAESSANQSINREIAKFYGSAMTVFKNLVFPVVEVVFHIQKDSSHRKSIKKHLRKDLVDALRVSSNLSWVTSAAPVTRYFDDLDRFFTTPLLCFLLSSSDSESAIESLAAGVHTHYIQLDELILDELRYKLKIYIIDKLAPNLFSNLKLASIEIEERRKHFTVSNIYAANFIQKPGVLDNATEVFHNSLGVLASLDSLANGPLLLHFMTVLVKSNNLQIEMSEFEFGVLTKLLSTPNAPSVKAQLFRFIKARLKESGTESLKLVNSLPFNSLLVDQLMELNKMATKAVPKVPTTPNSETLKAFVHGFVSMIRLFATFDQGTLFQAMMMYLILVIEDEVTQSKLLRSLLDCRNLLPELSELMKRVSEALKVVSVKDIDRILRLFRSQQLIHPIVVVTSKRLAKLESQLLVHIKRVHDYLKVAKSMEEVQSVEMDHLEILDSNVDNSVVFERLNISVFLLSKDNSFALNPKYFSLVSKIENRFAQLANSVGRFKVVLSFVLVLRNNSSFSKSSEFAETVVDCFVTSAFASERDCEVLFVQYLARIESGHLNRNDKAVSWVKLKMKDFQDPAKTETTPFDYVLLESVFVMLSTNPDLAAMLWDPVQLAECLLATRARTPKAKTIVDSFFCLLFKNNLLAEELSSPYKQTLNCSEFEIIRFSVFETVDRIFKFKGIDCLSERNSINYFCEKVNFEDGFAVLPILYLPSLNWD